MRGRINEDINRRDFLQTLGKCTLLLSFTKHLHAKPDKPNFIIIFCDDLGYGDIRCFGSTKHRTPYIDQMAEQGLKLTSFYVTSGVCTPSRSSLMTGSYPMRVNMHDSGKGEWVLFPGGTNGLNPNEITVAEILKKQGYATACIGKWHLGDQVEFLPTRQGFDSYYGIPYSNDMAASVRPNFPPLPLLRNEKVISKSVDQRLLTKQYTAEALDFIEKNKDQPFFLYLPHTMPHYPANASSAFRGKSANDVYGDAVEEIDWSTGQILQLLDKLDLADQTMVLFTSDNGAASRYGGSNQPLSGWKGSTREGGMRVPCVVQWPGKIPAATVCDEMSCTMDILPTLATLANGQLPSDRVIDGKDIWPLLSDPGNAKTPHEAFYYYFMDQLQAVRVGDYKLYLPLVKKQRGRKRKHVEQKLALYNLKKDVSESKNLANKHPNIVEKLLDYAKVAKKDIGDLDQKGEHQRPAGYIDNAEPLIEK